MQLPLFCSLPRGWGLTSYCVQSTFLWEVYLQFYSLFLLNNFFLRQKQHHTAHKASHFRSPRAKGADFVAETHTMCTSDETENKTWA